MDTVSDKVWALAEPLAREEGLEIVDVTFTKEGGRFILRIYIDKPEGVGIEDCERLSNKLDPVLDKADPIKHAYYLEVSSPGLDRPLKRREDFERFRGHKVKISTYAPLGGRRRFTGVLKGLLEDKVEIESSSEGTVLVPISEVAQARLVPEINWEGKK
ncbi:MAG: ribosome maturation factor RimP [Firmicutes bacterium]|jgi:ribosome maturation factor RimP|nr:ribosome maturation factor RimP [Bacillota bacterium]